MADADGIGKIIEKAVEDMDFRARLVTDPKSVISEELGRPVPDGVNIQVHENSATTMHLVLPPSGSLTDEELAVAAAANGGDPSQPGLGGWGSGSLPVNPFGHRGG